MSDLSRPEWRFYPAESTSEVWVEAPRRRIWLHVLLFVLTLVTTTAVGSRFQVNFNQGRALWDVASDLNPFTGLMAHPATILQGLPFSLTLLFILSVHELGHVLACRHYGITASYPYFIPAPTIIGTMGAFIRIKSPIRERRALFDVGIYGPIAGFVVTVPLLAVGLLMSRAVPVVYAKDTLGFGTPLLMMLMNRLLNPGVGEAHLLVHPVARAAWVGLFATALNLLPAGQLDGGHILFALSNRWHRVVSRAVAIVLGVPGVVMLACFGLRYVWPVYGVYLGWIGDYYWPGWFLWAVLLTFIGTRHPPIYDPSPLDAGRKKLAVFALVIFMLSFTFLPFFTYQD